MCLTLLDSGSRLRAAKSTWIVWKLHNYLSKGLWMSLWDKMTLCPRIRRIRRRYLKANMSWMSCSSFPHSLRWSLALLKNFLKRKRKLLVLNNRRKLAVRKNLKPSQDFFKKSEIKEIVECIQLFQLKMKRQKLKIYTKLTNLLV